MPILKHQHSRRLDVILVVAEGRSVVLTGTAFSREGRLFLQQDADVPEFPIPTEMIQQIQPVAPEVRALLGGSDHSVVLGERRDAGREDIHDPPRRSQLAELHAFAAG